MAEINEILWAPWRMQYIRTLEEEQKDGGCFLCQYWNDPSIDAERRVVDRLDRLEVGGQSAAGLELLGGQSHSDSPSAASSLACRITSPGKPLASRVAMALREVEGPGSTL